MAKYPWFHFNNWNSRFAPRNFLPKPITLYAFNEGQGTTVHDSSHYGQPLKLGSKGGLGFLWLNRTNGIEFVGPGVLRSSGPRTKLLDALQAANELSIVPWVSPAEETENEPASILSFSKGVKS